MVFPKSVKALKDTKRLSERINTTEDIMVRLETSSSGLQNRPRSNDYLSERSTVYQDTDMR